MEKKRAMAGIIIAAVFLSAISCSIPAFGSVQPSVIFSNFDRNNGYNDRDYSPVAYYVDQYEDLYDVDTAMAFTVIGSSYTLHEVELGVTLQDGDNELDIWIMEDNNNMPGSIIETIHASDDMSPYPGVYAPVTATSQLSPVLNSGEQYWIGLSAPDSSDTHIAWHNNTIGYTGSYARRDRRNGTGNWIYYSSEKCTFCVSGLPYIRTINVDDDGPEDPTPGDPNTSDPNEDGSLLHPYDSIQEAISDASNGDTVLIADGIYTGMGNRDIDLQAKSITVRSQNGPGNCTIDCQSAGRGFYLVNYEDMSTVLEGITIINGWDDDNGGAGIYCGPASPTITNCVIRNCEAPQGAGVICIYGSNPLMSKCVIIQNKALDGYGAGIYCDGISQPTITNCYIGYNIATNHGGGLAADYSAPIVRNSAFIGNESTYGNGGGIFCRGYFIQPTITNCTVTYNSADTGGGIYCDYDNQADISNCIIYFNSASYYPQVALALSQPSFSCIQNWTSGGTDNINTDPSLKTDKYHLKLDSPCRDAGNPAGVYSGQVDADDEPRVLNYLVDIGADELPPPVQNLTTGATYNLIQEAINDSSNGDTIVVSPGIHYPPNSYGIDFLGKEITLRSTDPNDPNVVMATVIDCLGDAMGFYFHNGEDPNSVLSGLTVANGYSSQMPGGGINCSQSNPTIKNCIIRDCQAWIGGGIYYYGSDSPLLQNCIIKNNSSTLGRGGGIYCADTDPIIENCRIRNNTPDGVWMGSQSTLNISGTVQVIFNDLVGNGDIYFLSGANLSMVNAEVLLNMSGPGTMEIEAGAEAVIDGDVVINLGDPANPTVKGVINAFGLLKVRNNVIITNAKFNLTRAAFKDNVSISNSEIHIDNKAPYGAIFIDPNTSFYNNDIYADGDRYMDLDPAIFDGDFVNCRIFVTITEGADDTRGGLFECRGEPGLTDVNSCDANNLFFCSANTGTIPDCNMSTWTLERLELTPGSKLNLTNRFPFQPPYDPGTDYDVVYVKELILRENSILNTSYNNIYYDSLVVEPNALVNNEPLLGFSMINIAFDDETEFLVRVTHNNYTDANDPNLSRLYVQRVEGLIPDPNGMMKMQNLIDQNPIHQQTINAKAKGLFSKSNEDRVLVRFEYLFETADPDVELLVLLSDIPELGDCNDANDYYEIARISPPLIGQPGSVGSGRFGVFEDYVSTGDLDFIMGTRIELQLIGPAGTTVYINNWDPQILCDGICLDLNWSDSADEEDFLMVIGSCGVSTELNSEGETYACLEGPFGANGTVDSQDICAWDWVLNDSDRMNLCGSIPLTGTASVSSNAAQSGPDVEVLNVPSVNFDDLMIGGKKGTTGAITKMQDGIYVFDETGSFSQGYAPASSRSNERLVNDFDGNIYMVNSETGIHRIETDEVIVAPRTISEITEPRYSSSASVYIGSHGTGGDTFGRPILDAAFDVDFSTNMYIYVVPVVVEPATEDAYLAAAKLQLTGGGSYTIVHIYDDPDAAAPGDNRKLDSLQEIETDTSGSVYVINAHSLNESDTLWRYNCSTGAMQDRLTLGNPTSATHVPAPCGMHASRFEQMLYMGSSLNAPNASSTSIYGFSTSGVMALARTVSIAGMGHVSDIADNPITGTLWVAGFTMDPPQYPNPYVLPFYDPYLAQIPIGSTAATASDTSTADAGNDLALPLSIVWTGPLPEKCGGADLSGNGIVEFHDFAKLATYWSHTNCASQSNCEGADLEPEGEPDGDVDISDLEVLCQNWLESGCN